MLRAMMSAFALPPEWLKCRSEAELKEVITLRLQQDTQAQPQPQSSAIRKPDERQQPNPPDSGASKE